MNEWLGGHLLKNYKETITFYDCGSIKKDDKEKLNEGK